ncbi:protein of unknown function [Taphrina deformans PYCC 5710]|uniref:Uncharacterized protein n=1 Tax=Taphrina deformans (strain PYCC 5710 / ATCC 11124 / CBS 356.35 / IMI 108563 / JCM 9778 / NBRC 8474) TaxID=1097556 RepID=R4XAQ4_TAPDE|nr:protein of unknown function [Taphrina deformans PYCC 5710]|eukprot:CCG82893.1 protein of unknown function [Taphrina deformans PYCC 5710]
MYKDESKKRKDSNDTENVVLPNKRRHSSITTRAEHPIKVLEDKKDVRQTTSEATRDDEAMAASALVSMFDHSRHDEENVSPEGSTKDGVGSTKSTTKRATSKSKTKTITSMCYECGTEQTSHFRPVVSDFIGKKSKTSEVFPRVEVCNKCYCKMAPKLSEYTAWRLGMLKKQIGLFSENGVQEFDISHEDVNSRREVEETLAFIGRLQEVSRTGGVLGTLKVRPIIRQ